MGTGDFSTSISASTNARGITTCWISIRGSARNSGVFLDTAGTDVALAAYLDLTHQSIPPGEQVNGRRFLVENYDPISAFAHSRDGDLTARAWLASMRGIDETAWFARDDLKPFGLMCMRMTRLQPPVPEPPSHPGHQVRT